MKITDYTKATSLAAADVMLVDGAGGTRGVTVDTLRTALFDSQGASQATRYAHRNTFRGKYLGATFTAAQKTAIQNGSFTDLWVGDYWTFGGINYRIADINYYLNTNGFTTNHLVIMPDTAIGTGGIWNSGTRLDQAGGNTGGYSSCDLRRGLLTTFKATVNGYFTNSFLPHNEYMMSYVGSNGLGAGEALMVADVLELPTFEQMFGSMALASANRGDLNSGNHQHVSNLQLALMQMAPEFIRSANADIWVRDHVSVSVWGGISSAGNPAGFAFTNKVGARPIFCIGA